jgi:hypothetical protein
MFFGMSNPYMNAPPFTKGHFVSTPSELKPLAMA